MTRSNPRKAWRKADLNRMAKQRPRFQPQWLDDEHYVGSTHGWEEDPFIGADVDSEYDFDDFVGKTDGRPTHGERVVDWGPGWMVVRVLWRLREDEEHWPNPGGWRVLGTSDEVTACEKCGKQNLRGTVVLTRGQGEVYWGSTCAAKATGKRAKRIRDEARWADQAARDAVVTTRWVSWSAERGPRGTRYWQVGREVPAAEVRPKIKARLDAALACTPSCPRRSHRHLEAEMKNPATLYKPGYSRLSKTESIQIGDIWTAKVSGKVIPVRVDDIVIRTTRGGRTQRMFKVSRADNGKRLKKLRGAQSFREFVTKHTLAHKVTLRGPGGSPERTYDRVIHGGGRSWPSSETQARQRFAREEGVEAPAGPSDFSYVGGLADLQLVNPPCKKCGGTGADPSPALARFGVGCSRCGGTGNTCPVCGRASFRDGPCSSCSRRSNPGEELALPIPPKVEEEIGSTQETHIDQSGIRFEKRGRRLHVVGPAQAILQMLTFAAMDYQPEREGGLDVPARTAGAVRKWVKQSHALLGQRSNPREPWRFRVVVQDRRVSVRSQETAPFLVLQILKRPGMAGYQRHIRRQQWENVDSGRTAEELRAKILSGYAGQPQASALAALDKHMGVRSNPGDVPPLYTCRAFHGGGEEQGCERQARGASSGGPPPGWGPVRGRSRPFLDRYCRACEAGTVARQSGRRKRLGINPAPAPACSHCTRPLSQAALDFAAEWRPMGETHLCLSCAEPTHAILADDELDQEYADDLRKARAREKRGNPGDADLRRLERAAATGDPQAEARYQRELARRGDYSAHTASTGLQARAYLRDIIAQEWRAYGLKSEHAWERKDVAKGLRAVFKAAGLKRSDYTAKTPSYSMANSIDIQPKNQHALRVIQETLRLQPLGSGLGLFSVYPSNREDRSDWQTDYFRPEGASLEPRYWRIFMSALAGVGVKKKAAPAPVKHPPGALNALFEAGQLVGAQVKTTGYAGGMHPGIWQVVDVSPGSILVGKVGKRGGLLKVGPGKRYKFKIGGKRGYRDALDPLLRLGATLHKAPVALNPLRPSPGDRGRRELERLACTGDPQAAAAFQAAKRRAGKGHWAVVTWRGNERVAIASGLSKSAAKAIRDAQEVPELYWIDGAWANPPDAALRELERAAATGDREAEARLRKQRARYGAGTPSQRLQAGQRVTFTKTVEYRGAGGSIYRGVWEILAPADTADGRHRNIMLVRVGKTGKTLSWSSPSGVRNNLRGISNEHFDQLVADGTISLEPVPDPKRRKKKAKRNPAPANAKRAPKKKATRKATRMTGYILRAKKKFRRENAAWKDVHREWGVGTYDVAPAHTKTHWRWVWVPGGKKGARKRQKNPGLAVVGNPVERVSIKEIRRLFGNKAADKAIERAQLFHGSDYKPKWASIVMVPDGKKTTTRKLMVALGRAPETHYFTDSQRSNKRDAHWVHKHPRGGEPLLALDPDTGTWTTLPTTSDTRATDWLRD